MNLKNYPMNRRTKTGLAGEIIKLRKLLERNPHGSYNSHRIEGAIAALRWASCLDQSVSVQYKKGLL